MYQKRLLDIQDQSTTVQKRGGKPPRRWKRVVFKFLFKSIELLWALIRVVATLGGFFRFVTELLSRQWW